MLPPRKLPALSYIPKRVMMRTVFVVLRIRNDISESFARLGLTSLMRIPNSSEFVVGTTLKSIL
jgi:hypothetical protein